MGVGYGLYRNGYGNMYEIGILDNVGFVNIKLVIKRVFKKLLKDLNRGVNSYLQLKSSQPPFFKSWFSSPNFKCLPGLPHLKFFPTALKLQGRGNFIPFPFNVIFFSTSLPPPLLNLIFFPNRLDNHPKGCGDMELYTPVVLYEK